MKIEFAEDGPGIGIPYDRCERQDGINHGYLDLKHCPEKINFIPELEGYPELFRFVREANREASLFRTAGCAMSVVPPCDSLGEYRSFIHLMFEILHWNTSRSCYRTLYERFCASVPASPYGEVEAKILFRLGPTSFWHHGFDGWSLRLHVDGTGDSDDAARESWQAGLTQLSGFLAEFSAEHQMQLRGCSKRVS